MTCTFLGTDPLVITPQTNVVTVVAPASVNVGDTFDVTFRLESPGMSPTPFDIDNLEFTTTYSASGPVTPSGSFDLHQAPDSFPKGSTVTFQTFTKSFTATGTGTVDFRFVHLDYQYALAHASCYADIPSTVAPTVLITSTDVAAAALATTVAPSTTTQAPAAQAAATATPRFTG